MHVSRVGVLYWLPYTHIHTHMHTHVAISQTNTIIMYKDRNVHIFTCTNMKSCLINLMRRNDCVSDWQNHQCGRKRWLKKSQIISLIESSSKANKFTYVCINVWKSDRQVCIVNSSNIIWMSQPPFQSSLTAILMVLPVTVTNTYVQRKTQLRSSIGRNNIFKKILFV